MAIVQDCYDLTDDILTKILTGEYRRIGSVVRYATGPNKGQIVKHLKPIKLEKAEEAVNVGAKVLKFVKDNKEFVIIGGVVTVITAAGVVTYKLMTREPKVVKEFRAALKKYVTSIRQGSLTLVTIEELMARLDDLRKHKDYEKISVKLTTEELDVLVNRIYEYTVRLAKDNEFELTGKNNIFESDKGTSIIDLRKYLSVQKNIFASAA